MSQSSPPRIAFTDGRRPGLTLAEELLRSIPRLSRSERVFVFAGTVAGLRSTLAALSADAASTSGWPPVLRRGRGVSDGQW